jgi:hypothetical protein
MVCGRVKVGVAKVNSSGIGVLCEDLDIVAVGKNIVLMESKG